MNNQSIDNHFGKYTLAEGQVYYPAIDTERLGWALVICIFILGLPV